MVDLSIVMGQFTRGYPTHWYTPKQSWFMIHENFWFLMAFYLGLLNRLIGQTAGEVIFICNLERFWHLGYFFIWEHHWSVFMFSINHSIKYITWTPLLYFNTTWIEWFIDIGSIGLTQWQFLALGPWSSSNFRFRSFRSYEILRYLLKSTKSSLILYYTYIKIRWEETY